jgi:hypothetical protein
MKNGRNAAITAAIACALSAPLAIGSYAARADEMSDVRANQELIQSRVDQLAQIQPGAVAPTAPGAPIGAGSFPRSFMIPGTDTSLRLGGFGNARVTWWLRGMQPSNALFGAGGGNIDRQEGYGGTGNLPNIPLNTPFNASYARSSGFFITGKSSRIFIDARTPTAWGSAQAYMEFDFNNSNNNVLTNGVFSVVPQYTMRLRQAYAALGPWLAGHANGTFGDNDAEIEVIDDGGGAGGRGRARNGQVRYTWATPWPGITVVAAAEQPASEFSGPNGRFASDSSPVATAACPTANLSTGATPTTTINPANQLATACLANSAEFDAAQVREPAGVLAVRFNQPWGHLRFSTVVKDAILHDGRGLDKTWVGYGGAVSGDVKPFPVWSPRDDLTFGAVAGEGVGGYVPTTDAVATNYGTALGGSDPRLVGGMTGAGCSIVVPAPAGSAPCSFNTVTPAGVAARSAYNSRVIGKTITAFGLKIGYQHWWTAELRSNAHFGVWHQDVPIVRGVTAANRGAINKELSIAAVNLMWSPVAFVTTGIEYGWGHRVTATEAKGDSHTIQGLLRVSF